VTRLESAWRWNEHCKGRICLCAREYLVMGCGQLVLYDITPCTSNTMLELEADRLSDQERRIWPPLLQGPKTLGGSLTRVAAEGVAHVVGEERGERELESREQLAPLIVALNTGI
jgi:hypothetical protein